MIKLHKQNKKSCMHEGLHYYTRIKNDLNICNIIIFKIRRKLSQYYLNKSINKRARTFG